MLQKLKTWWKIDDIVCEKNTLEAELTSTREQINALELALNLANEKNNVLNLELVSLKEKNINFHESTIPWFELSTDTLDAVKGLQVEMDWNEAFVQHLKDNGHTGRDEEILIQKWLAMLYEDIIDKLEQKLIDNKSNKENGSDFE